ncbi:BioY family transporter [Spirochaetia bacterium]|nr:BioY family transporter [Spirochaetia bacterium]
MSDTSVSVSGKRKAIVRTTLTALFAALTAAGSFISIPLPFTPIPIVLTNFFVVLSGTVLGPVMGALALALYLVAGAIGAPVFAGGTGGFARLLGPSGGFLTGYLFAAALAGLIAGRPRAGVKTPLWRLILAVAAGLLVVYVPGLLQLKAVTGQEWPVVIAGGFLPFLIGDGIKGAAAVLIAPRLRALTADLLD